MATRAQVNNLAGRTVRRMVKAYVDITINPASAFIRTVISETKALNTPVITAARNAMLREMYTDIFGVDPVGKREFVIWVRSHLSPALPDELGIKGDPITDVSLDDSFEATPEDII